MDADEWLLLGKRNDEEGAKEKLYVYASHVQVVSFKVSHLSYFLFTFFPDSTLQGLETVVSDAWDSSLYYVMYLYAHICINMNIHAKSKTIQHSHETLRQTWG
jgi:hypothetical protein